MHKSDGIIIIGLSISVACLLVGVKELVLRPMLSADVSAQAQKTYVAVSVDGAGDWMSPTAIVTIRHAASGRCYTFLSRAAAVSPLLEVQCQ